MVKDVKFTVLRLVTVALFMFDIVIITSLIQSKVFTRLWIKADVHPSVTLPTPIIGEEPFEYCVYQEDSSVANQINAGTPVPMEPVFLGPTPTMQIPIEPEFTETPLSTEPTPTPESTPTFEPTATQPVYNEIDAWQVEVVDPGNFKEKNFHFVVIGVGYTDEANEPKLREIVSGLEINFAQVNVDFAFVQSSLNVNLEHADQAVDFSNQEDLENLLAKIRTEYPVDSIIIAIETSLYLGTSDTRHFAMSSGSDPNSLLMATHETAHLLGLGDGYKAYYSDGMLPNNELFYLDSMPRILSEALLKLDNIPPMYDVGTCKGKSLYTFYERSGNIMSDYNPQGPNSWGDSLFTPLQIQIMNDYVDSLK
jgi:hypothetical protein